MLGAILAHILAHTLIECLAMLGFCHVDEIDDDDASHISETELAGQFVGGGEIDIKGVLLLSVVLLGAVAGVDVNDMHSLRTFNVHIGSVLITDYASERACYLARDIEIVEDWQLSCVMVYDALALGGDECHIVLYLAENGGIVYIDAFKSGVEEIAKESDGSACLFIDEGGLFRCGGLNGALHGGLPTLIEDLYFLFKVSRLATFRHSANDDADILGFESLDYLLETGTLCTAGDFGTDMNLVVERHKDEEASGETEFASQSRPFRRYGLLDYLHKHLLLCLEDFLYMPFLATRVFTSRNLLQCAVLLPGDSVGVVLLHPWPVKAKIEIMEERVALAPYIHKTSVESWHDLSDACQINVADGIMRQSPFLLEFSQTLIFQEGDGHFVLGNIYNEFACHSSVD